MNKITKKIKQLDRSITQTRRPRFVADFRPLITIFLFIAVVALVGYPSHQLQLSRAEAHEVKNTLSVTELERDMARSEVEEWKQDFDKKVTESFSVKKANDWKEFKTMVKAIAPVYDIPEQSVKVAIAQATLESARGTSSIARERNNYFGYTCYDGKEYESCTWFASPYESIIEYFRLIKNNKRYAKAYAVRNDPEQMIREIKLAGYATDKNYVSKIMALEEWNEK